MLIYYKVTGTQGSLFSSEEKMSKEMTEKIEQTHQSIGDNVGNDKNVNNNHNAPTGMSVTGNVHIKKMEVNGSSFDVLGLTIDIGKPLKDCTPEDFEKIEKLLSMAVQRPVKLVFAEEGSIKLFLTGSQKGLQRLANLQAEGKLEELLNQLKSDDMPEIKVKKAEFIEDKEVIQKAKLIRHIQESKVHKKNLLRWAWAKLSRANLSGVNLSGAYLSGAYLGWAYLNESDLRETNLSGAYLSWADLRGADLRGANLSGADLSGVDLRGANLSGADLSGADLRGADLSGANLRGANLSRAKIDKKTQLNNKWRLVHEIINNNQQNRNLHSQDLSFAYLQDSFLFHANLMGANLTSSDLKYVNLREADLSGSNLTNANLENANLINAVFDHAIVKRAKFKDNEGITEGLKRDLKARGAIFADDFGAGDRELAKV